MTNVLMIDESILIYHPVQFHEIKSIMVLLFSTLPTIQFYPEQLRMF